MNAFLPFIVIGLVVGSVYGLAGLGLVLTYKTSGIFNIGYGAVACGAAFIFYALWGSTDGLGLGRPSSRWAYSHLSPGAASRWSQGA